MTSSIKPSSTSGSSRWGVFMAIPWSGVESGAGASASDHHFRLFAAWTRAPLTAPRLGPRHWSPARARMSGMRVVAQRHPPRFEFHIFRSSDALGADPGLKRLIANSDGTTVPLPGRPWPSICRNALALDMGTMSTLHWSTQMSDGSDMPYGVAKARGLAWICPCLLCAGFE